MSGAKIEDVTQLLTAIANGVQAASEDHNVSPLFLWMLIKEDAERQIKRIDTDYR